MKRAAPIDNESNYGTECSTQNTTSSSYAALTSEDQNENREEGFNSPFLSVAPPETRNNFLLQNMSNRSLADVMYYLHDQSMHTVDNTFSDRVLAALSPPDVSQAISDNEDTEVRTPLITLL